MKIQFKTKYLKPVMDVLITEVEDLQDSLKLISNYSRDNMIFITKVYDKWVYHVASHGLADIIGLTPQELEKELNNGNFAKRVASQKELKQFMIDSREQVEKQEEFNHIFTIYDKNHKKIDVKLSFTPVKDKSININYILRTSILEK